MAAPGTAWHIACAPCRCPRARRRPPPAALRPRPPCLQRFVGLWPSNPTRLSQQPTHTGALIHSFSLGSLPALQRFVVRHAGGHLIPSCKSVVARLLAFLQRCQREDVRARAAGVAC